MQLAAPIGIDAKSSLTVKSLTMVQKIAAPAAATGTPGTTSIGVWARATLNLVDAELIAAGGTKGGDAAPALPPQEQAPGCIVPFAACNDGKEGGTGPAAKKSDGWSLTTEGYKPGNGYNGAPGGSGMAGTKGGPETKLGPCATGCSGGGGCRSQSRFNSQQKHIAQDGVLFVPVPRDRQAAVVKFLAENAFATQSWMIGPEILRRIAPNGVLDRIKTTQQGLLNQLMSSSRFARLIEQEAMDGEKAYRPVDFLADVRKGIWSELGGAGAVKIDAYRRNLQRVYLDLLDDKLNGRSAVSDDQRPFIRGEFKALNSDISRCNGSDYRQGFPDAPGRREGSNQ